MSNGSFVLGVKWICVGYPTNLVCVPSVYTLITSDVLCDCILHRYHIDMRKKRARFRFMDKRHCPVCRREIGDDPRAIYCGDTHRWMAFWARLAEQAPELSQLPLATLPAEAEEVLPAGGPERLLVATKLVVVGKAPAGAAGYRVGFRLESPVYRWYPPARHRDMPMFLLDPFEQPVVPRRGLYLVVYMDRRCRAIGGPRYSIGVDHADQRLRVSDGDRTYKPRVR